MTYFEEEVMLLVCNRRTTNLAGLPNTYKDFCELWKKRNFSETFNHVLRYRLREVEYNMLKDAYLYNLSIEEMSKKYKTSKEKITETLDFIINLLSETLIYKELCVGSKNYNKIFQEQRNKIDKILDTESSVFIDEMSLSHKAYQCICKELNTNKRINAKTVLELVSDVTKIPGVGDVTALHIINTFEKYGFSCTKWIKNLK